MGGRTSSSAGKWLVALTLLALFLCLCLALATLGFVIWSQVLAQTTSIPEPTQLPAPNSSLLATPDSSPVPATPTATAPDKTTRSPSPSPQMLTTQERLLATELPQRDVRLLAERLAKRGPIPEIVHEAPPVYQVGDESRFWVSNMDSLEQLQVTAVLVHITPHLYMWLDKDVPLDEPALVRAAENFETHIYPTTRALFGSEWSPGVDGDPRLHILHSTGRYMGGSVAGYYSSADEYSRLANPYSNEREMFTIALEGGMAPDTEFYSGVLAHEFQHMIHWASDRNEDTWVNEGCSELAAYLNGYDPGGFDASFLADPDVQLTTWPELNSAAPHYGGSYLFMAYLWGRFGEEAVRRVVAHPANGAAGIDAVLGDYGLTFEDVFADWLVANYVDAIGVGRDGQDRDSGRYNYPDQTIGPVSLNGTYDDYPLHHTSTVHQYAADYVELRGTGDYVIEFAGETQARLMPIDAHSGRYAWWSNRGDDSDTTLTRAFDLRSVDQATLQAWMWYDIEEDWDHAYVEVSSDGGQTWDILAGPSSTTRNPTGNSYGPAYTGASGKWIRETYDLDPYAGQQVLVRFEYVTDDGVNRAGWMIDDVCIPELGYCDDLESGPGGWETHGFVYSDNRVAQRYLVQLIVLERPKGATAGQMRVLGMPLDDAQRGRLEVRGLGETVDRAILVIAALAPATTEVATYEYAIDPLP